MKERVEYLTSEFIDYKGEIHPFVICAVSQVLPRTVKELGDNSLTDDELAKVSYEVNTYIEDYGTGDYFDVVCKVLKLGVAICNPFDTFNEEVGQKKALARARTSDPVIYATKPGVINTTMVQALLKQEAKYIQDNPETLIKGYAETRDKYIASKKLEKEFQSLTSFEKQIVEVASKDESFLNKIKKFLINVRN